MNIKKGTRVHLLTTNGGDTVATLLEDYRPTYAAYFTRSTGGYFIVAPERIKSVQALNHEMRVAA